MYDLAAHVWDSKRYQIINFSAKKVECIENYIIGSIDLVNM
jgi:hypothetical protein